MSNTAKWIIGLIAVVLIIVGVVSTTGEDKMSSSSDEKIKIGASMPLTGDAASLGEFMRGGVELAVKEINENGGINGREVELIIEDDECGNAGVDAMNKLVNIDNVDVVVGSICSAAAGPALPVAQKANTPVIVWGTAPKLTATGDYIFRNYPSDKLQGKFAADFIRNELNKDRVASLYVDNDWGKGLNDIFVEELPQLGGEIVASEAIQQGASDLRTVLSKIKSSNPDVIYAPVYPKTGSIMSRQLEELDMDIPVVAGDAFLGEESLSVPEAEGTMVTQAKTNLPDEFASHVKEETGKEPNVFTPFAYDSVKIFAQVIREVGTDSEAIKDALSDLTYENSIATPTVEFDDQGDIKFSEFEVVVVEDGETVPYGE